MTGGRIRVGISGWRYARWRGTFYPPGLPQRRELEYAASRFGSVEINGSFYSLQRPSSYARWAAETPEDFVFAVKGGRYITHMLKLVGVETALANFFASGVLALGSKLGPVLWQLPPVLRADPGRLTQFFALLPRTTTAAAQLAARHDAKVPDDRALTTALGDRPIRHSLEVRHGSYTDSAVLDLLRRHDIGVVVADTAGKWPLLEEVTSDFVHVRLHGAEELYVSGYTPDALDHWAGRCAAWADAGCDVFVYFDNDVKVHAPFDALALMDRLGLSAPGPVGVEADEGEQAADPLRRRR
ncbi:MAG TPA: DUF72 domain-containing protein [Segeticoccus sp.]|uniref:DUF72 domain-containing protein n=1 Tax=Segeticoccus sp. TaxID=2706531 RepID=UPI002D7FFE95|nr:DUF72 domain-containing protein [Segeticoccus sp.]HET8601041.1 DUF72 domain-containing protein [Segeticoccus sp.]